MLSDETAICENNEGSFECICDDGYTRNLQWIKGKFRFRKNLNCDFAENPKK